MDRIEALSQFPEVKWRDFPAEGTSVGIVNPSAACIHQFIEQRAAETPDAIALICRDQRLSYSELNARANQVASWLSKLGVGPDKLVGISVERSLEMVICLLGILKSGGAYLPLDPAYPAERLAFMLQDAQAAVLLYQRDPAPESASSHTHCVPLDACLKLIQAEPVANLDRGVLPAHLAYVIYTSGSTGRPKGVLIEHRNVASFFEAMNSRVPHGTGATWLAVTSPSFDISVLELFWTLSRGFTVVLYPGDETAATRTSREKARGSVQHTPSVTEGFSDYSIPALIERHGVTHLQCTPSMASMLLVDQRTRDAFGRLQTLLIGGETFPASLAQQLGAIVRGTILNMYGPTETTVWSTTYQVPPGTSFSRIPVGQPIADTQIYIVDADLQSVPVGVAGELLIGGSGVARGYLGREQLTAERFIPNPFAGNGAPRLYRTGDLARYLPDGNIELLGRLDQQVKIRGHRVELGEIEIRLNEHPAVRESVVIARETGNGDKILAAYIIRREGQTLTLEQVRRHLQQKLPEHMVPGHIVFMTAFPQTPNRKIDRNAFPAPDEVCEPQAELEQPTTPVEVALAAMWKDLLRIPQAARHQNFFESGGHSMLAIQLVIRVKKRFNVDLTLRNIFEYQTLAGMADIIEALSLSNSSKTRRAGQREVVDV
jgi:non-ribosomal peptide synthetase component F